MNLFCFEVNLFLFRKFFFRSIKCPVSFIMRKENKYEKKNGCFEVYNTI